MRKFCLLLVGTLLLISCDKNRAFDSYNTVQNIGWHTDSIQQFSLPVMDSLKKHNLYFNIRNNNKYPFSNLFVIASVDYPNGKKQVDTLEYQMALATGEWLGAGGASVMESKLWYKEGFQFKEQGVYKVSIAQTMRTNGSAEGITYLKGITDVGLRVETVEKP